MTKPKPKPTGNSKTAAPKKAAGELAKATLTGDLRDAVLQIVQTQKKPWTQLSEAEQRGVVSNVEKRVESMAAQAVKIIAADGRKYMEGQLEQVTVKDGLKAVITFSKTDSQRHDLIDATGCAVLIVANDKSVFTGERGKPAIMKDQPVLALDKPVADNGKNIPQGVDKKANAGLKGLDKLMAPKADAGDKAA